MGELEKMKALVWKGMADGAVGFSTGLQYVPGTYSKTPEIIELARVAANAGGLYASHMRNEGTALEAVGRRSDPRRRSGRRAGADLAPEGRQPEPMGCERESAGDDRCGAEARPGGRGGPVRLHRRRARRSASGFRRGRSKAASRRSPSASTIPRRGRGSRVRSGACLPSAGFKDLSFAKIASYRADPVP